MLETAAPVNSPVKLKQTRYRMGGLVSIEAYHEDAVLAASAVEDAFVEIKRVEEMLSRFLPDSAVSKINRLRAGIRLPLSRELFDLFARLLAWSQATGGAFDITTGALTQLWSNCEKAGRTPNQAEIKAALSRTGFRHVNLDSENQSICLQTAGVQFDLGAAGKGYALDCAAARLRMRGVSNAVLSAGSSIVHIGNEPEFFAVQHPLRQHQTAAVLEVHDSSLSTSASYERFFSIRGRRYGHILDPCTGFPVRGRFLSVSAAAPSALFSEVLSTAFFAGGKSAVRPLLAGAGSESGVLFIEQSVIPKLLKINRIGNIPGARRHRRWF